MDFVDWYPQYSLIRERMAITRRCIWWIYHFIENLELTKYGHTCIIRHLTVILFIGVLQACAIGHGALLIFIDIHLYQRQMRSTHDDVIKWKYFFRVTGRVWGEFTGHRWIPRTNASDAMFSLILAWINSWVNNREAGDLRRHRAHYDVTVMMYKLNVEATGWVQQALTSYRWLSARLQ